MNIARFLTALGLAALGLPALAADGMSLTGETEYTSGKYGGARSTDILFMPFVARYEAGPTIVKLTVPYVEISGPGNVQIAGGTGVGQAATGPVTPATPRGKVSGLGDIVAGASYNAFYDASSGLLIDIGSKLKFATASKNKGLGTGKSDFSVQADAYRSLSRSGTLMATLGYTWMGKPEGGNFRNVAFASLGIAWKLDADTTASGFLDYRQAVAAAGAAPRELTFYLSRRLGKHWKIQACALVGASGASPAKGIGAALGYSM
ncbi:MAG: hypothetical protein HY777_04580 [Betaproteobacteria bacterium]|nr:hypothetical protein [Betaproteobacteria bacterium]